MKFSQVIERLRDGKAYTFKYPNLKGYFYKAPFPSNDKQTELDGTCSAITYYVGNERGSPVMLVDDFSRDDWIMEHSFCHPLAKDRNCT